MDVMTDTFGRTDQRKVHAFLPSDSRNHALPGQSFHRGAEYRSTNVVNKDRSSQSAGIFLNQLQKSFFRFPVKPSVRGIGSYSRLVKVQVGELTSVHRFNAQT